MKKVFVILLVAAVACTAAFAEFDVANVNLNVGAGVQSSLGLSYEYDKWEFGADVRTFYFSYLLNLAAPIRDDGKSSDYFSADFYTLYEIHQGKYFTFDLGASFLVNPLRHGIAQCSSTEWQATAHKVALFQTRSCTFTADLKVSYDINEKSSISFTAQFPIIGISSASGSTGSADPVNAYLLELKRQVRVGYTYSF